MLTISKMEDSISQRGKERPKKRGKIKGTMNCALKKGERHEVF